MKIKGILLILLILVIIPEILLVSYASSKYTLSIDFSTNYQIDFLPFLLYNPMFFILVLVLFIMMAILYFTLKK